eukprot:609096_1
MMSHITTLLLLLLFNRAFTQPPYVYDGHSTVNISGQYNWTLKYPLGAICEDWTWGKRMTINIMRKSKEADLVFAFGTQSEYFAFVMAWDNIICVPLKYKPSNCKTIFITPQTGAPLQQSMVSLEQQYARSDDFRDSLILLDVDSTDTDYHWTEQTKQWEVLVDAPRTDPWVQNVSPLILDIRADRWKEETYLTIEKNGQSASITMGSTWDFDGEVFLYMGLDAIHEEIFELNGITTDDQCSWTARPTTAVPTQDTTSPTQKPSLSPTDSTSEPTKSPTRVPTPNTDDCNWRCYLDNYLDLQQENCKCIPTEFPTQTPITRNPTVFPSTYPSKYPTIVPTNVPSIVSDSPSHDSTASLTVIPSSITDTQSRDPTVMVITVSSSDDIDVHSDESDESEAATSKSMINGIDNTYLLIGAGAIVLLILLVLIVVIVVRKVKGRTMREPIADDDEW